MPKRISLVLPFNGKSLEWGGSHAGEVVLCSGLVDAGRAHRRYMEPHFIIISHLVARVV